MGQLQHFSLVLKPAMANCVLNFMLSNVIQSEHYDDEGLLHIDIRIAPHKLEQLIRQAKLPYR